MTIRRWPSPPLHDSRYQLGPRVTPRRSGLCSRLLPQGLIMAKPPVIRESKVEKEIREWAEPADGGWPSSHPQAQAAARPPVYPQRGSPVRGDQAPRQYRHRSKPSRHKEMRAHGAIVRVWDNVNDAKSDLDFF